MNSNPIPLSDVELQAIEELREQYSGLSPELFEAIEQLFRQTRILLSKIFESGTDELREGQLALMGITYRTFELVLGGIQQTTRGNKHVFAACFRGLLETFGAIVYVNEKPMRLPALIQGEGIGQGKLVNAAYKTLQGLKDDYSRMSSLVHPKSASLLLGLNAVDDVTRLAIISIPPRSISDEEAVANIDVLVYICKLIYEDVQEFLNSHSEAVGSGAVKAEPAFNGIVR